MIKRLKKSREKNHNREVKERVREKSHDREVKDRGRKRSHDREAKDRDKEKSRNAEANDRYKEREIIEPERESMSLNHKGWSSSIDPKTTCMSSVDRQSGDDEAMALDEAFCKALEYGLPPTRWLGFGY
ncbi:hypothetical protein Tco_1127934 [Tanacetum coccineum]